jgi:hypothetical protein
VHTLPPDRALERAREVIRLADELGQQRPVPDLGGRFRRPPDLPRNLNFVEVGEDLKGPSASQSGATGRCTAPYIGEPWPSEQVKLGRQALRMGRRLELLDRASRMPKAASSASPAKAALVCPHPPRQHARHHRYRSATQPPLLNFAVVGRASNGDGAR